MNTQEGITMILPSTLDSFSFSLIIIVIIIPCSILILPFASLPIQPTMTESTLHEKYLISFDCPDEPVREGRAGIIFPFL